MNSRTVSNTVPVRRRLLRRSYPQAVVSNHRVAHAGR